MPISSSTFQVSKNLGYLAVSFVCNSNLMILEQQILTGNKYEYIL